MPSVAAHMHFLTGCGSLREGKGVYRKDSGKEGVVSRLRLVSSIMLHCSTFEKYIALPLDVL